MRALKYLPGYTVADYQLWEGEWELIDGLAYAMTPSPNLRHQDIGSEVLTEIRQRLKALKGCGNGCKVIYELDWIVNDTTVVRPDIALICNQNGDFIQQAPILIIELLSPSTAIRGRHLKYEIYEEQRVPYYIIIDPETLAYNIFVLTHNRYVEQNATTAFSINADCALLFDLAKILAAI